MDNTEKRAMLYDQCEIVRKHIDFDNQRVATLEMQISIARNVLAEAHKRVNMLTMEMINMQGDTQ